MFGLIIFRIPISVSSTSFSLICLLPTFLVLNWKKQQGLYTVNTNDSSIAYTVTGTYHIRFWCYYWDTTTQPQISCHLNSQELISSHNPEGFQIEQTLTTGDTIYFKIQNSTTVGHCFGWRLIRIILTFKVSSTI